MASEALVVGASSVPVAPARHPLPPWRRAFRTTVVVLLAAGITPFIVPLPHARAALQRAVDALQRARRRHRQ